MQEVVVLCNINKQQKYNWNVSRDDNMQWHNAFSMLDLKINFILQQFVCQRID
jgi:hypothetical protein